MGAAVFNTVGTSDPRPAGSIPVHLRHTHQSDAYSALVRSPLVLVALLVAVSSAACATPETVEGQSAETTPASGVDIGTLAPESAPTPTTSTTIAVPPTTLPPTTTTTLPEPWEVAGHHRGPIPADEQIRCSADSGGLTVGDALTVEGHDDRPTLLQPAADPTAPLVVVFHGQNGCIENVQSRSDLDVIAAPAGVAVLWLSGRPLPTRSWNTNGTCCEPASNNGVQDMPYVEAAIGAALAAGLEPRRTLSAGVSNGGGMAISVACRRPDLFDAAVSVAGWAPISCDRLPLSLLVFGGSADESLGSARATQVATMWTSDVVTCPEPPVEESSGIRDTTTWSGCSDGTSVRLVRLQGVPHVWPKFVDYDMDDDIVLFALGRYDSI